MADWKSKAVGSAVILFNDGSTAHMRWHEPKRLSVLFRRKVDFQKLSELLAGAHHLSEKQRCPEQWRAIGWAQHKLVTVIYEERNGADGTYYWIVTAWPSSKAEEALFNEGQKDE